MISKVKGKTEISLYLAFRIELGFLHLRVRRSRDAEFDYSGEHCLSEASCAAN